jgi:diaminopimelate epimerase
MLVKISATGNDFILSPAPLVTAASARAEAVRQWCHRHEGIGADGAVFIDPHPSLDFAWDFYNSDGSVAEMCGNAARAVALYMSSRLNKKSLRFLTRSGEVQAQVHSPDDIEVSLAPVAEAQWNQWSDNDIDKLSFDFVRAGVPHAVLRVPDVSDRDRLRALALEIKREPRFLAQGVNVTFVRPTGSLRLESVTFERGVEDFTLSCGTGAVASAHSVLRGEEDKSVEVQVPGGQLSVVWKKGRPHLRGPAKIIAEIRWMMGV